MFKRVGHNIAAHEFVFRLGKDAGDVKRDIAVADDDCPRTAERGLQCGELGIAIIPADKGRAADDAGQIIARDAYRPIMRGAGGQPNGIVKTLKFAYADLLAAQDRSEESRVGKEGVNK